MATYSLDKRIAKFFWFLFFFFFWLRTVARHLHSLPFTQSKSLSLYLLRSAYERQCMQVQKYHPKCMVLVLVAIVLPRVHFSIDNVGNSHRMKLKSLGVWRLSKLCATSDFSIEILFADFSGNETTETARHTHTFWKMHGKAKIAEDKKTNTIFK